MHHVSVQLDEKVAADVLVLVRTVAGWGDEWADILGRAAEAIEPLQNVTGIEDERDSRGRMAEAAIVMAAKQ